MAEAPNIYYLKSQIEYAEYMKKVDQDPSLLSETPPQHIVEFSEQVIRDAQSRTASQPPSSAELMALEESRRSADSRPSEEALEESTIRRVIGRVNTISTYKPS